MGGSKWMVDAAVRRVVVLTTAAIVAGCGTGGGDATADTSSSGGDSSGTSPTTTMQPSTTNEPTGTTVEPTTSGPSTTSETTDGPPPETTGTDTNPTTGDTTTGAPACEIMLPPPEECPVAAPRRILGAAASRGGIADIDDYAPEPDEVQGGFIVEPDGGGFPVECDTFVQDCADGEKCMPWANDGGSSWNATRCSPLDPNPAAIGDPCVVEGSGVSGIDNCDVGAMCFGVDGETNMGTCVELCSCSADFPVCETENTTCAISNDGVLAVCLPVCNPLDADACGRGLGCYPVNDIFLCAPDASGELGAAGDPCEFINVCDTGNFCGSSELLPGGCGASGCCVPFCTIGDDSTCLDGQSCVPWYAEGQAPDDCLATIGACSQ